ncbi:MAG: hypothetical protein HY299_12195 [Verrucomicrobia bacterium]|nr:hypothetical protein [Verrucomicrobiota bacterium]
MRVPIRKAAITAFALLGTAVIQSYAGHYANNFDTDPSADLVLRGNAKWRPTGGQGEDPSVSGYISITDALNGQSGKIVFDDFDSGQVVAGFKFDIDLRVGGGTSSPADGYSINFARLGDGSLDNEGNPDGNDWASSPTGEGNLPEEGVKNGISVCIDEWFSGGADVIGITVRVDNDIIFNKSYPTLNGNVDDRSSLQTGPASRPVIPDGGDGIPGNVNDHGWAHLSIGVDPDGTVDVSYKGEKILDNFQTPYGPSPGRIVFAGRTGGANSNHHADNLDITTVPSATAVVGGAKGTACEFSVQVSDSGASVLDPTSATFKLDGVAIVPKATTKVDTTTTFEFDAPAPLPSGSSHTVDVAAKDTSNNDVAGQRKLQTPTYALAPAGLVSGLDNSIERGWKAKTHWLQNSRYPTDDVNKTTAAERQIAEGFLDADGNPLANIQDSSAVVDGRTSLDHDNVYNVDGVVNMDQAAGGNGNFQGGDYKEIIFPGIPSGDKNNIAIEFSAYVELPAGCYTFGVNSDDGFKFSMGRGLSDVFGTTLGEFDGGRGASDSTFNILVTAGGLYPIRVLWWEGGGGANLEIFSVDKNGKKHLLNDDADPDSIRVYRGGVAKSYVASVMPVHRQYGGQQPESPVIVKVVDGSSPVGAITLTIDGVTQAASVSKDGNTTTLRVDYPNGQVPGQHVASVAFDGLNFGWEFNISRLQKSAGNNNFVIEAEHYDSFGDAPAEVNAMPLDGTLMAGLDAALHKDYYDEDNGDSLGHRGMKRVNMDKRMGNGVNGLMNNENRGSYDLNNNYKIGWIGAGEYFQYKRTVPAGDYLVVASLSFDNQDDHNTRGRLSVGDGQANPTMLGSFDGIGTHGWGVNNLLTLRDGAGEVGVYTSDGTEKNFRFNADQGDYDYFAFVPTTDASLGPVVRAAGGATARGAWTADVANRVGKVVVGSIKVKIDGASVAASAAASAGGASVSYTPAADYGAVGSSHTYEVAYSDNNGASYAKSGNFTVVGNSFYIEAEDFNYGAGKNLAVASHMPYYGGAYAGLNAIEGIDIDNHDDDSSNVYRIGEENIDGTHANVNITGQGDLGRDGWTMTQNFRSGWTGGEWGNFTRNIPAGNYEVWEALSFDGHDPHQLHASLGLVTSDPSQPNQTVQHLGTFDAPGSGGWGNNNYVQLTDDADGLPAVVTIGAGPTTLRSYNDSGDFDWIKLVPTTRARLQKVVDLGAGTITLSWNNGDVLMQSDAIDGVFTKVVPQSNGSATVPIASVGNKFYKLVHQ